MPRNAAKIRMSRGMPAARAPVEGVENLSQEGAKRGHDADLPALQNAADHQHGKQVQEAEGDILVGAPVGERDEGDQESALSRTDLVPPRRKKESMGMRAGLVIF